MYKLTYSHADGLLQDARCNANGKTKVGDIEIGLEQMKDKLKAIFETRKNKQVYIQADTKVDYGVVAATMAEIRAALDA